MTRRLEAMGSEKYTGLVNSGKAHFNGIVRTHPESLEQPLRRKKATIYFVNSMSDLFHPKVPFEFIAGVFGVMAATPQHTYQVLTKRPEQAIKFFSWLDSQGSDPTSRCSEMTFQATTGGIEIDAESTPSNWPLENVWIGTSVEDDRVISRIDALREVPAQVRFLSCEPLIGELNLDGQLDGVQWVIVGGESGAGARPMRAEWAAAIKEACKKDGVAYFFKQTGRVLARESGLGDSKGSKADAWPEAIQKIGGRAFPQAA